MKPIHWLLPALVLAFCDPAKAAMTQTPSFMACAPETEMAGLLKGLGVNPVAGGTSGTDDENIGEVWVNPRTRQWLVLKREPQAERACILIIGEQMTAAGPKS
ncbi:hypothetical protein [Aestuariivirga litoralis]|uniref:hypothetical protein n=1 Tax=Aestuariivirga litoralis TaxID=2650924 RepID=UPI0018C74E89|nr:hypothetical protein [Aestuariivirga litoralis]MBG1232960.1 hypothetical protein [Aestuariivirga litoralis]